MKLINDVYSREGTSQLFNRSASERLDRTSVENVERDDSTCIVVVVHMICETDFHIRS